MATATSGSTEEPAIPRRRQQLRLDVDRADGLVRRLRNELRTPGSARFHSVVSVLMGLNFCAIVLMSEPDLSGELSVSSALFALQLVAAPGFMLYGLAIDAARDRAVHEGLYVDAGAGPRLSGSQRQRARPASRAGH